MNIPTIKLNDGNNIPAIGFGTFQIPNDGSTYRAVKEALALGYRHIDTAVAYFNEKEVCQAVKDSGIPREEIWITSKLWLQDYGYVPAKAAIKRSLRTLGLDYMDLYLLHQPYGDVPGAWCALEEAKTEGLIHSIGVSNMTPTLWQKYVPEFNTIPSVNQVEFNPYVQQRQLREILSKDDVMLEAWAPLGQGNAELLHDPLIVQLAEKYHKDVGQIILRFENQEGIIVFPKSVHAARIERNLHIFDFELTQEELAQLRQLDTGQPSHNPDAPGVAEMLLNAFDVHAND